MRKKIAALFAAALAFVFMTPTQSQAAPYYSTVNSNYGNVLCLAQDVNDDLNLIKAQCGTDWNKQWWFEDGTWGKIVNRWSGECLTVAQSWAEVYMVSCSSSPWGSQQWLYVPSTGQFVSGTYTEAYCLDFDTYSDWPGGAVLLYPCNGHQAQSFWRNTNP